MAYFKVMPATTVQSNMSYLQFRPTNDKRKKIGKTEPELQFYKKSLLIAIAIIMHMMHMI